MKVGDTIWEFDVNRRKYAKGISARPIWKEHWRPCKIVGETTRSWLIGPEWNLQKVPKTNPNPRKWMMSKKSLEQAAYVEQNKYGMAELIRRDVTYIQLKLIENIMRGK